MNDKGSSLFSNDGEPHFLEPPKGGNELIHPINHPIQPGHNSLTASLSLQQTLIHIMYKYYFMQKDAAVIILLYVSSVYKERMTGRNERYIMVGKGKIDQSLCNNQHE